MQIKQLAAGIVAGAAFLGAASAAQALSFDQNVTPDVIFGSGNANGGFTVDQNNGVEIGIRAKLRFDNNNQPQNVFNSNGDGTYTFGAGQPDGGGFGFASGSSGTAVWNFEWSINTNFDGSSGLNLSDLFYALSLDGDPSAGVDFLTFDLINGQPFFDHAIGNNGTGNGGGTKGDAANYDGLIENNNVAQNSWNYEFFNDPGTALENFNSNVPGDYRIRLQAFDRNGQELARSEITVINAIPVPAAAPLMAAVVGVFALAGWRRRQS